MLEFLKKLLNLKNAAKEQPAEAGQVLRTIVHSEVLTDIVRATGTPVDDLVLQLVRALVPKEIA